MLDQNHIVLTGASIGDPSFELAVEAAARAGFHGLSLRTTTYTEAKSRGISARAMRSMLAEAGVVVNDLDAILISTDVDASGVLNFKNNVKAILGIADALEIKRVNTVFVGDGELLEAEINLYADAFAQASELVTALGIRPYIEFVPSMSPVKNLRAASKILEASGQSEAGIMLDTWHCHVGSTTEADLQTLAGDRVLGVQISDIPDKPPEALIKVGLHERQPPGQGKLDLVEFIKMLDNKGSIAPLALEVFNDRLLKLYEPVELACYYGDAMRNVLAEARK